MKTQAGSADKSGNLNADENSKNRTETGQTNRTDRTARLPKTHQDFWKTRLKRRRYQDRDGKLVEAPEWQVRMFHLGREAWFNLDSANQAVAAVKARDIYLSLISSGWEATLVKFKPSTPAKNECCTLGEFFADVEKRSHLKPATVRRYALKLRKLVADVAKVEAGLKAKERRSKYDYLNGGHQRWLARIDGQPLSLLTPEIVNQWRNAYVAKAGTDPVARKSAERTAASILRCSRAFFAPDVLAMLKVPLPPNPFAGVKLKDPGPQRYHSDVNPEWLIACAERELRTAQPQEYIALSLCLWGGLRRKEADTLTWAQVDFAEAQINVRRTEHFEPKTEESQRTVDVPVAVLNVLRSFKKDSTSEFVLDGGAANPAATYDFYRADCTWRRLHAWLKSHGVRQQKAIHALRKESGSLVATAFGIEAARQHLGHRDITTTSAHYVEKRRRIEVQIPNLSTEPASTGSSRISSRGGSTLHARTWVSST
ncbi:MAG TPA: tyrosine-type recombinase/integrase [Opitutaceae bacterium]|nr:tyrosine-type recombinase/integrase [Opitutaceae bacterium]